MNRIDYDLIVNELLKSLNDEQSQKQYGYGIPVKTYFREFRTVGFGTTRQTGKSKWLAERILLDPSAILIVRDHLQREYLVENIIRDRTFYPDVVSPQREYAEARITTIKGLRHYVQTGGHLAHYLPLRKYETFYFDEASHCFHFVEDQFYLHLVETQNMLARIVLVG